MSSRRSSDDLKEVIRDFRRDQVIDVARRLFGERGSTDVSMDEIATEAGVARSTVYVYFANRGELLRACLQRMYSQLREAIAITWEQEDEPARRLERLIEEMLARVDDSPAFFRLALVTQGTPANDAEVVAVELALIGLDIARLLHDLLEQGVANGEFRPVDLDIAVSLIGQQIYGAMAVRAGEPAPRPRADAAADTTRFILYGLTAGTGLGPTG
jgi:AcrR family transcriptional regulator